MPLVSIQTVFQKSLGEKFFEDFFIMFLAAFGHLLIRTPVVRNLANMHKNKHMSYSDKVYLKMWKKKAHTVSYNEHTRNGCKKNSVLRQALTWRGDPPAKQVPCCLSTAQFPPSNSLPHPLSLFHPSPHCFHPRDILLLQVKKQHQQYGNASRSGTLMDFGILFMTALAAVSKISKNSKVFSWN
jgi:hypothetical protein